jgi:BirA family biotin operon repressor/biotin-[acetyl-CoA-carboxylase] ligase
MSALSVDDDSAAAFASFAREVSGARSPTLRNVLVFGRLASTNTLARRLVDHYLEDELELPRLAIVAGSQTAGRGRLGRVWHSPSGTGVWASVLQAPAPADQLSRLPMAVAVGLVEALATASGLAAGERLRLKWPNDLLLDGRKLGGILIEAVQRGATRGGLVIGFGVNVLAAPAEAPLSIALAEGAAGALPSVGTLAASLLGAVDAACERLIDVTLVERYRRYSAHRPGDELRCQVGSELVTGEVLGFDAEGRLRLRTAGGDERVLGAGEVVET